jgi:hypothetical protein
MEYFAGTCSSKLEIGEFIQFRPRGVVDDHDKTRSDDGLLGMSSAPLICAPQPYTCAWTRQQFVAECNKTNA